MEKNIKDYLQYYVGQFVHIENSGTFKLTGFNRQEERYGIKSGAYTRWLPMSEKFKPILRKLESLQHEEIIQLFKLRGLVGEPTKILRTGIDGGFMQIEFDIDGEYHSDYQDLVALRRKQIPYLLSLGIDLWDLIESGLALEKQPATV